MRTVGLVFPAKKAKAAEAKEPKEAKAKEAKAEAEVVQPDTDEAELKEE